MNSEDLFLKYTSQFDNNIGRIRLKILHTMKVAEVSDRLCSMLDLPDHLKELARIVAVFHDIGRFEQVTKYNTFNDQISEDHAKIACRVLEENGLLEDLNERERYQVLTAIRNHNQYVIEDGLDEDTLLLCKLIRDADKIDILRVFATEDPVDTMGESAEQVAKEKISDDVFELIMDHRQIPKSVRKTGLDFWIGFLGFVFGLYFPESLSIIREAGHYRLRFDQTDFTEEETKERLKQILSMVERYLTGKKLAQQ